VPENTSGRDCSSALNAIRPSAVNGCGGAAALILCRQNVEPAGGISQWLKVRQMRVQIEGAHSLQNSESILGCVDLDGCR
jgi:hypothetical protein